MLGHKVLDSSAVVIQQGTARMLAAACAACGLPSVPRLLRCSRCGNGRFTASPLDPAGVLYAFSEVAVAPKGWTVPYLVGYVDMRAGIRLFARLAFGLDVARPGLAVVLQIKQCQGQAGRYYYQFIEAQALNSEPACVQGADILGPPEDVST